MLVGLINRLADISNRIHEKSVIRPQAENHARYDPLHAIFREIYANTNAQMHKLADLYRRQEPVKYINE